MRCVYSQYSSSVSPLLAKTGVPLTARAAAAWSCVEKMLQLAQRMSAPRACSVSISTAVWMVMCKLPAMRAPLSGCVRRVLAANGHQAGHFVLGNGDFLAAPVGQGQIGDDVIVAVRVRLAFRDGRFGCGGCHR